MKQKVRFTLLAMVLSLGIVGIVFAASSDMSLFRGAYPTSTLASNCQVCHTSSPPSLNPYGSAYFTISRTAASIAAIASQDSDRDGFTNVIEINAGFNPGDAASRPPAVAAPVIGSFTASPASIISGQSATLAWTLSGGAPTTLTISNGVGTVTGTSRAVSPTTTTTYTLTAANSAASVT